MNSPNCQNDNLSTVFLLVVLGFLIYYLTRPKKVKQEEPFENLKSEQKRMPVNSNSVSPMPTMRSESPRPESPRSEMARMESPRSEMVRRESRAEMESPRSEMARREARPEMARPESPRSEMAKARPTAMPKPDGYDPVYNHIDGADLDEAMVTESNQLGNVNLMAVDINQKNVTEYDANDFLPKEINNLWFDTDFSQAKYNVNDDKLINTERYVIGINTVGQSLKNASYDIRGTVPNPKFSVSPWNNSTYEADYNLKSLC